MGISVYERITSKIIELLEGGIVPWRRPWSGCLPTNLSSGKEYKGINILMLSCQDFDSPYWLTFKQAIKLGGNVRAGERSPAFVVFSESYAQKVQEQDGSESVELRRVLRYTPVFNVEQCRGIEAPEPQGRHLNSIEACEVFIASLQDRPKLGKGSIGAYDPASDTIIMPDRQFFETSEAYYSVLFHELVHWTGTSSRLNRPTLVNTYGFGSRLYAKEELIAEMGAGFLCAKMGIDNSTIENSASYIASWLDVLKRDKRVIPEASSRGREAVEFLQAGARASA